MTAIKQCALLLGTFLPSPLRVALWRLLGFKVGRGCRVSMLSIVVADRIELGPGAVIEPLTLIYRPTVFAMGQRSRIASFVRIVGHQGVVTLKAQSYIALGCLIDSTGDFELGERSQIGPRSTLYSHGATGLIFNRRYPHRIGAVKIGVDCWIGMGCIVHPQVTVGDRVIVLPGLAVRSNIPDDTAMVNPAEEHRLISTRRLLIGVTDEVRQAKILALIHQLKSRHSAAQIVETGPGLIQLRLSGQKTVHLLTADAVKAGCLKLNPEQDVVWTLFESGVVEGVPSFCFERLLVFGPWTDFAEQIAAFLCSEGGVHFAFRDVTGDKPSGSGNDEAR